MGNDMKKIMDRHALVRGEADHELLQFFLGVLLLGGGIYWALVTAGYLAWSFLTNGWDRTWIVWPVAAVAYGAVYGIIKALRHKNG